MSRNLAAQILHRSGLHFTKLRLSGTVPFSRSLYTKEALGLDTYEAARERSATQLGTMKDRFKVRMKEYLSGDSKSLIFTEDLKNMLYLAENDQDLEMIQQMMKKYSKQNEQMRFGTFVFGPVLMRLLYHMKKTDMALAAIKNPDISSMFDQFSSYNLVMDMLYEDKRYNEVLELYDTLTKRPAFAGKFPKDALVLVAAACYKLATPESGKKAMEILKNITDSNVPVARRAVAYTAALALHNNEPAQALEILAISPTQNYVTLRNIKILALLRLGRFEDVLPILRSVIEQDAPFQKKTMASFFPDVYKEVKAAAEKIDDNEVKQEYEKVFKTLEAGPHIDEMTLVEFLDKPIQEFVPRNAPLPARGFNRQQTGDRGGFNRYRDEQGNARFQPQGFQPRFANRDAEGTGQTRQPIYRERSDIDQGGDRGSGRFQRGSMSQQSGGGFAGRYGDRRANTQDLDEDFEDNEGDRRRPQGGGYERQGREMGFRGRSSGGGDRSGDYNPNREAGYRPSGGFRSRTTVQRQGLKEDSELD